MAKLIIKVLGVIFLVVFLIYLFYSPRLKFDVLENPNKSTTTNRTEQTPHSQTETENPAPKEGVGTWIGQDIHYLTNKFGQANRIYPFKDNYTNYVFKRDQQYYIVSTKNDKIKSVYATGQKAKIDSLKINESASHIFENTSINPDPSFKVNGKEYTFELSDEDIKTQALIKYGKIYAQIYVDQQSNRIMGVRYLDKEALAFLKPYQLASEEDNTESYDDSGELNEDNAGKLPYEQNPNQLMTLYEITNEMRKLKDIKPLAINTDIAHIAAMNLYEATSKEDVEFTEDALKSQLDNEGIDFKSTSQNVGYDFDDVPTLIHSWMNSDIHRSRILNTKYDEMGGEVMKNYYSLIFVEK
ncbi:CAP-associated domain-containing protein [Staphylococcus petrasii]|uniref:CAP-associated domain-containing protein n=1 Tax=Staphylococcus petrasii TaxID=1276936 RepID=UPI000CD30C4D|nr:CAP-associated domain-containing protein [Staphylococcus petrasii]MCI2773320.1 CAP-associated domain-containing protein [Staphylococcus petrasii]PNZ84574.1 SCP-like extracellular protein [Staphylococcus petrasii]TGA82428.1 SCP-like extracellular protein [Staphylococcus petrasii]SUM60403.1 Allergen V5/Tpx-1 related protein [Staphylococcus petrasii]